MNPEQWNAVDHYLGDLFVPPDAALDAAIQTVGSKGYDGLAIAA